MIYKNGKVIISVGDELMSFPFGGTITATGRKRLLEGINSLSESLDPINDTTLLEYLAKELKSVVGDTRATKTLDIIRNKGFDIIDELLDVFREDISKYIKEYEIQDEELRSLKEDDYRYAYNTGDKTYNEEEYRGLLSLKIKCSLYMFVIIMMEVDTHPNKIDSLFTKHKVIKGTEHYNRLYRFIEGHVDTKPSILMDVGELMNVIPITENIINILTINACIKLASAQDRRLIKGVYDIIRQSRKPTVKIYSKSSGADLSEEVSWVSSFRQASEISLGEVGEIQEYFSSLAELKQHYGILDSEDYLLEESRKMCEVFIKESKYGTYIDLPPHIGEFIYPVVASIISQGHVKYLEVPQIINVVGITYVLMMRIGKRFAYLLHTVIDENDDFNNKYSEFVDPNLTVDDIGMPSMTISPSAEELTKATKTLFYNTENNDEIKRMLAKINTTLSNTYATSLRGGHVIDIYKEIKLDYLKYLLITLTI